MQIRLSWPVCFLIGALVGLLSAVVAPALAAMYDTIFYPEWQFLYSWTFFVILGFACGSLTAIVLHALYGRHDDVQRPPP